MTNGVPSESHLNGLRELYVTLDRMTEYVTGMDAWFVDGMLDATENAIDRVEAALDDEREAEINAEADELVAAMEQVVREVER